MKNIKFVVLVIVVALLSGCATIRVYSEDDRAPALVDAAGSRLGTRAVMAPRPGPGVTVLRIEKSRWSEEKQKQLCGTAEEKVLSAKSVMDALENGVLDCEPAAWSCPNEEAVAHELGHVYGLAHTDEGLMAPQLNDDLTVTDKQKKTVKALAIGLAVACENLK